MGSPWVHRLTDVDRENRSAVCAECGPVKIKLQGKNAPRCKTKADEHRGSGWKGNTYGVTRDEYEIKRIEQKHSCGICEEPLTGDRFEHLDHDHDTLEFRGILCRGCNLGLGNFRDSPDLLLAAIEYLQKT